MRNVQKTQKSNNKTRGISVQDEAVSAALQNVLMYEPTTILGMRGMGKDVVYSEILDRLMKISEQRQVEHKIMHIHVVMSEDLGVFLPKVVEQTKPTVCVINLSTPEDVSDHIRRLDVLRHKRGGSLITIITSGINSVKKALEDRLKVVTVSMKVLTPLCGEDAQRLLRRFEAKFSCEFEENIRGRIVMLSGGNIGLLKSLVRFADENPRSRLDEQELLEEDALVYRLSSVIDGLSESQLNSLIRCDRNSSDYAFLKNFGFIRDGQVFTPLLSAYLEQRTSFGDHELLQALSPEETEIFEHLREHLGTIVDRSSIAKVIWGNRWEKEFSVWSVDQAVLKIKKKIEASGSPYGIKIKRGLGIILDKA